MVTGIFQTAGLLAIVAAFYITDFALIARHDRQRRAEGSGRSWDYTLMILAAAVVVMLQPVVVPGLSLRLRGAGGAALQIAGLLLAVGGLALHWVARMSLTVYYAERVEVQPDHVIIDTGPYRHVRHPVFTSFFMIVTGCLLFCPSPFTLLLAVYAFWDFSRAARQEEALLSQTLPGYASYMDRTPAFFPDLSRKWRQHRER